MKAQADQLARRGVQAILTPERPPSLSGDQQILLGTPLWPTEAFGEVMRPWVQSPEERAQCTRAAEGFYGGSRDPGVRALTWNHRPSQGGDPSVVSGASVADGTGT